MKNSDDLASLDCSDSEVGIYTTLTSAPEDREKKRKELSDAVGYFTLQGKGKDPRQPGAAQTKTLSVGGELECKNNALRGGKSRSMPKNFPRGEWRTGGRNGRKN